MGKNNAKREQKLSKMEEEWDKVAVKPEPQSTIVKPRTLTDKTPEEIQKMKQDILDKRAQKKEEPEKEEG